MTRILLLAALALALTNAQAASTTIALQRVVNDVVTNNTDPQRGTNGAAWVYPAYREAGERNEDSTTGTDYVNAAPETKCDAIDVATDSTTVYNGPARLYWVYVNTALSATDNPFKDNATSKFTLAQSLARGTNITVPGMRFDTSLVFDPDNAATGNITVCYAPLDAGVTY